MSYCPMKFVMSKTSARGELRATDCQCETADCAWWNYAQGVCALVAIYYMNKED